MFRLAHVPWLLFRRDGAIDPSLKLELKGPADPHIDVLYNARLDRTMAR